MNSVKKKAYKKLITWKNAVLFLSNVIIRTIKHICLFLRYIFFTFTGKHCLFKHTKQLVQADLDSGAQKDWIM